MASTTDTPQVTKADQWKGAATEGIVVTLPSGNIVRVKRTMDLIHLLKSGRIPNPLSGIVQKMVDNKETNMSLEAMEPETIKAMFKLVDDTVLKCVLEPTVEAPPEPLPDEDAETYEERVKDWKPAPDNISLHWIDMDDRMFIFVFAQGFAADLESFRKEQEAAMAQLSDGKAVQPKAKRPSRAK